MKSKDLKKGMRVQLRSGWYATAVKNPTGNIVDLDVEGTFRETGSCYVHDIMKVQLVNGSWEAMEHSAKNLECKRMVELIFGG